MKLKNLLGVLLLAFLSTPSFGDLLVREDFDYADGTPLVGQDPPYGSVWTAHSGAGNKAIQVAGGQISLEQSGGSGEDVNTGFTQQGAAAITFLRNLISLSQADRPSILTAVVCISHTSRIPDLTSGHTGIVVPAGAGDFGLAINADNSNLGAGVSWISDLSFDTTYRVVTSFDASTGTSQMWVDPVNMGSSSVMHTGTETGTLIESYAFRQSNDFIGTITVDNLVVSNNFDQVLTGIPEPSSALIVGVGMIGMIIRRRRN